LSFDRKKARLTTKVSSWVHKRYRNRVLWCAWTADWVWICEVELY